MIDIAGLDKASVIQALYAAARPLGMGFMHYTEGPLDRAKAEELVGEYLDYLDGRVMKVQIGPGDTFEERLYDRDNGQGAAARVIESLRSGDTATAEEIHRHGVQTAAKAALADMGKPNTVEKTDHVMTYGLHLPDDPTLRERVVKAQKATGQ